MYPAQPDSPDYTLAADITAIATTITFADLTGLLAAPNTLTIRVDDTDTTPETVYYATYVSGNTLTVTRGYGGTTAKSFIAGAKACRAHTAFDHNTFRSNILDLDSTTFHKATAGEINALTAKSPPVSADVLMIEDSTTSFAKKKITVSELVLTGDSRVALATASTIGLCPILANTSTKYLRDDGTWQVPPSGSGTVTSVASGNGMNFTTITGSGTVTMGTPGSITSSSTNAVSTTSHTHAIDTTIFTAANGKSVTTPIVDGTATIGASNTWADGAHVHPTDTSRAATNQALDTFGATTNITTLNATTTAHGLLLTAVAPAAGLISFVGIANGETSYALKALFDTTLPSMNGSASAGTALTSARIDHIHATDTSRAAATSLGSWGAFSPNPVWGTADPTITTTVARYCRTGNTVTFNVSFVISNGNAASSLTMSLPVAAPQTANYQLPLIAFKKITTGGSSIMSDPFAYIDYTLATPVIKFHSFGTLGTPPTVYTAVLNISGSYEVPA